MDTELFKKPTTWAVLIPAIALLVAIYCTISMLGERKESDILAETADKAFKDARYIIQMTGIANNNTAGETARYFDGIASARECAAAAVIPEHKLLRVESGSPQAQADGTFLRRETYHLDQVRLTQIAYFIDYAERGYRDLVCTTLTIRKARSRERDLWDLTATIEYLTD
ncbi:MAG: hypothetical protein JW936_01725 [Sedimentisphaerales bacterium]|nr:hypothetical protein [Sedimentisphaerales bacterium]